MLRCGRCLPHAYRLIWNAHAVRMVQLMGAFPASASLLGSESAASDGERSRVPRSSLCGVGDRAATRAASGVGNASRFRTRVRKCTSGGHAATQSGVRRCCLGLASTHPACGYRTPREGALCESRRAAIGSPSRPEHTTAPKRSRQIPRSRREATSASASHSSPSCSCRRRCDAHRVRASCSPHHVPRVPCARIPKTSAERGGSEGGPRAGGVRNCVSYPAIRQVSIEL